MIHPFLTIYWPVYILLLVGLTWLVGSGWTYYFATAHVCRPRTLYRVVVLRLGKMILAGGVYYEY